MESLPQLPVVSSDYDLKKLRELYDKIESTVRSLYGMEHDKKLVENF